MLLTMIVDHSVRRSEVDRDMEFFTAVVKNMKNTDRMKGSGDMQLTQMHNGNYVIEVSVADTDEGDTVLQELRKVGAHNRCITEQLSGYLQAEQGDNKEPDC